MLEYIYCYIYIQLYKQPGQEGECCINFSRFHRCAQVNTAVHRESALSSKPKISHIHFFEKVENSWKFSPYGPPYKLVMQTEVGSQELRPAGICLGDSPSKTGHSGCWLGAIGCIAGSPSPGPSFWGLPLGKASKGFGEREDSEKGKTNSKLKKWRELSARAPGTGTCVHLVPAEILDFWGSTHSEYQACLGRSLS